jgi:hypothetical protein
VKDQIEKFMNNGTHILLTISKEIHGKVCGMARKASLIGVRTTAEIAF